MTLYFEAGGITRTWTVLVAWVWANILNVSSLMVCSMFTQRGPTTYQSRRSLT